LLERNSEEEYRPQYREYVRKLETVAKDPNKRDLSDLLESFVESWTSKMEHNSSQSRNMKDGGDVAS
jgi:flagellar hook-associated protein FlgK